MTREEYEDKRIELVADYVMNLDDEATITLHNAYCDTNNYDDTIFPNDEYTFNEMMGNKAPYDLAMDLEGSNYSTNDDYFAIGIYGPVSFDSPFDDNSPVCLSDILNRDADSIIELLDDANIDHDDLDNELDSLEKEYQKARFKAEWEEMCLQVTPMFEFSNDRYCYINYDENLGTLETGSVCNAGFCLTEDTVEMEVDYDFSLDENLQNLYEQIIQEHPEYEDTDH